MGSFALGYLAAGLGAGLAVIGAGFGIGKIGASAMEGTARQPSAGGDIRTTMIIAAALIEGVALFAEVVCIILATAKYAGAARARAS
jgi:F-type H+-transporting ATPase subunit c